MKQWKETIKSIKPKNNAKAAKIVDVYKKEILDTRITVSELARNQRTSKISDLKITDKKAFCCI